jgi:KaiC/GvpD/RAD55 family RecA-like ATPase
MLERQLLKLLLNKPFYDANKARVVETMFSGDMASIYTAIRTAHDRYGRSLNVAELRALHRTLFPSMTRAQRTAVEELFVDLENDPDIGPDVGQDVLSRVWRIEQGRRVSEIGLEIMDGKSDLQPLIQLIERTRDDFLPADSAAPVEQDLSVLLSELDDSNRWHFNIPPLSKRIPGLAPGEFMINFARPETGKTAFNVHLVFGPGGFLAQGARTVYVGNEEPAKRTMLRGIMSYTGYNKEELPLHVDAAASQFAVVRKNLEMFDDVDMNMERLDVLCRTLKPDVLVLDQLDKIHVGGKFARMDQAHRERYVQARELAKRHGLALIGTCQASAEAEGKTRVHYSMMEESKTGKAAEADLIIGIGKNPVADGAEEDLTRFLYASKNKISGWHGVGIAMLDPKLSRYVE